MCRLSGPRGAGWLKGLPVSKAQLHVRTPLRRREALRRRGAFRRRASSRALRRHRAAARRRSALRRRRAFRRHRAVRRRRALRRRSALRRRKALRRRRAFRQLAARSWLPAAQLSQHLLLTPEMTGKFGNICHFQHCGSRRHPFAFPESNCKCDMPSRAYSGFDPYVSLGSNYSRSRMFSRSAV